jgi:hypothetical protein
LHEGSKMTTKLCFAVTVLFITSMWAQQQSNPAPNAPSATKPVTPAATGKPDITDVKPGITIGGAIGGVGGKFVPWGGTADLSDVAPLSGTAANGRCAFNATYEETNTGTAVTSPTYVNKLKLDGSTVVAINNTRHLNVRESKLVTTQAYLIEGSHSLTLSLDDGNLVAESNESNNVFSIKYALQCKSQPGKPIVGIPPGKGKPDLISALTSPMSGRLLVRNIGTGPAGASKLVLECHKVGHTGAGGGCADPAPEFAATYSDPAFPDKVTIHVPPLPPGAAWTHTLAFWGTLKWTSGKYTFKAIADAANTVAESNETNNAAAGALTVP